MFLNSAFLDCKGFVTRFAPQVSNDKREMLNRIVLYLVIHRGFVNRFLHPT